MNPSSSQEPFRPGRVIGGKYRVERQLAEGGIGVVLLAIHLQLGQRVAIKVLQSKVLTNRTLVARFEREAQLAASIRSEHVVRVFDVGTLEDGGPYMVMEYLEGEDLGSVLARGAVPRAEAIDYVIQACCAMAEAHGMGIVHRDIKPENLFLARRGSGAPIVKIVDFGISKSPVSALPGGRVARMTEDGDRFGTPLYMSPEQLHSSTDVDARSDIWALGVVLFELLTGEMPFDGETVPQIAASILTMPAKRLGASLRAAPRELEAAIAKCLEKKRELRFRNVAELAQELAPWGTPAAQVAALDVFRIVRDLGASVRPARPASALGVDPTLVPASDPRGPAVTLEALVSTRPLASPAPRGRKSALVAGAMAAIGAVIACVIIGVSASSRAPVGHALLAVETSARAFGATAAPSASADEEPRALASPRLPSIASVVPSAARAPVVAGVRPASPSGAEAGVAKTRGPLTPAPRVISAAPRAVVEKNADYKEFGERR